MTGWKLAPRWFALALFVLFLVPSAYALQASLLCDVEVDQGNEKTKGTIRVHIDEGVWAVEEAGAKGELKVIEGVDTESAEIRLYPRRMHELQNVERNTIIIDRVTLTLRSIQTIRGVNYTVASGICKRIDFLPLRKL
jgi:hypothetical protein